ncbi:MAG: endonuclease III domain-containing protein, partial [Nitrospinota bacterium]
AAYAHSPSGVLEEEIRPCGFYRNKAKAIRAVCAALDKDHGGRVPKELDALVALPGVGRKTANIVLTEAYGIPGIAVDTHVLRVSARLGFSKGTDPVKTEFELMELIPRERWIRYNQLITTHGRRCCTARKPNCTGCPVYELCPWEGKPRRPQTPKARAERG